MSEEDGNGMDQRNHPRIDLEVPADLSPDKRPDYEDVLMANLSLGGCFIRTNVPEPPGAMVMLRFALPGADPQRLVKAVGRVCWVKEGADGASGMGVQFVRVEDTDLRELSNYIAGLLDTDSAAAERAA